MGTAAKLDCTLLAVVVLAEEEVLAATRTRQLRRTLRRPGERSLVHTSGLRALEQIDSHTSHARHPQRNVLIPQLSVRMHSRPGRT